MCLHVAGAAPTGQTKVQYQARGSRQLRQEPELSNPSHHILRPVLEGDTYFSTSTAGAAAGRRRASVSPDDPRGPGHTMSTGRRTGTRLSPGSNGSGCFLVQDPSRHGCSDELGFRATMPLQVRYYLVGSDDHIEIAHCHHKIEPKILSCD